ncbi:MAG: CvpA family protein [Ruminococcaceae bacterium]|nr:CvpA family protein [Oscillospiraceae bacterium]
MWMILDLIILAIIGFFVFTSAKRGFVRTVLEVIGYFLAIYLAFTLGGLLADVIYNSLIEPNIIKSVSENITLSTGANINETVNNVWNSLPGIVVNAAEIFDITPDTLRATLSDNLVNNTTSLTIAKYVANSVVRPILVTLIKAIIGFVLFIILLFVVKILAKTINKIFSLPLIGGLNRFLGGVIGFVKGAIISIIFITVTMLLMSFFENGFLIFTNENIEQTILFKFLADFSPFK